MTQRVNIQYSIDIEQLPSEINRLVKETESNLCDISSSIISKESGEVDISLETVFSVNELRQKLSAIDHQLLDINNIMNGYINFLTKPPPEEDAEQGEEQQAQQDQSDIYPAREVADSIDELELKLSKFKTSSQENHDPITIKKSELTEEMPKSIT